MCTFAENYLLIQEKILMKHTGFIIFFSIVLSLYGLLNFYIIRRGLQALPATGWPRHGFIYILLILVLAYPFSRLLERFAHPAISQILVQIGAYYLAAMVIAFFALLVIDLFRLIHHFLPFTPVSMRGYHTPLTLKAFLVVACAVVLTTLIGAVNAYYPRVRTLDLAIEKSSPLPQLKVVFASDLHLGTLIHNSRMRHMVELINRQNPDVILLGGDIFDEDVASLSRQNMAQVLQQLRAPHGVYAIPGNHEYFSGIDRALDYMEEAGITVLRDRTLKVENAYYLVGRDDRQSHSLGSGRVELHALMDTLDAALPIILMDHQPFQLEEAERAGVDLQLSGHTHHGQLFPFEFITKKVYEVSWGYKRKGNTQVYVSCGAGTWGPPVRTNSTPEIMVLNLHFTGNHKPNGF